MYHFAVVALLGLVTLKVVELLIELVPGVGRTSTLATFAVGIATSVVLDYSMLAAFGIAVREQWMGTVATGLIVGALAFAWQAAFGWLGTGSGDTAETRSPRRPRIAA
jgi:hypothetical protein